jgi:outer membrane protein assembly complex protein YaeT
VRADVTAVMITHPRPWWTPWRRPPALDPLALREDVERIRVLYRARGYYEATVTAEVTIDAADAHGVDVVIAIEEGEVVRVDSVSVTIDGAHLPNEASLIESLSLRRGEPFEERDYDAGRRTLRRAYRDASYGRATVDKHARVDLDTHRAVVRYEIRTGPPCVFGEVHVTGTSAVDPAVVLADVAFHPGEVFRQQAIERTRTQLDKSHLFYTVRVDPEPGTSDVVDVHVDVREAPPRDVRLGVGYDTEEGPRGIASWRHYDFLGGGRQLGFTARASLIERSGTADFMQPHWPSAGSTSRLLLTYQEEDEDSFDLHRARGSPRLEWQPTPEVTTFLFDRIEYDQLTNVPVAVQVALPGGAPHHSILSGVGVGVDGIWADDPVDPQRGIATTFSAEVAGLGGDVHLVRIVSTTSVWHPLGFWGLLGAARLRLGIVDPIAGDEQVPLFERLYAGGVNSVRGYERWHVGPLADDHPLGGRALVEMSGEVRHTIVGNFQGAVFVDAGQVDLAGDRFPIGHLQVGTGFGVLYKSPIGPVRVDLGFPLDRPAGDAAWQVTLSIGRAF